MAIYPGAQWRPIGATPGNRSNGPMHSYRGAVLHVNQSNGNLYNFIKTNPGGTSCHFEFYKDGTVEQYIDTAMSSWCQGSSISDEGNDNWISFECEGFDTEAMPAPMVSALARAYSWLHAVHGVPLHLAESPAGTGFGWHGMGGAAWGGHPACPGALRRPQRQTILDLIGEDMTPDQDNKLTAIYEAVFLGGPSMPDGTKSMGQSLADLRGLISALPTTAGQVDVATLGTELATSLSASLPAAVIAALKAAL